MQIYKVIASLTLIGTLHAGSAAVANEITNGDFETGDLTGWTLSLNSFAGVDGLAPHSGSFGFFNGSLNESTLTQTIATTAGTIYDISFWLQNEADATGASEPNSFAASFGGASLVSLIDSPAFGYTQYTFSLAATSASSDLSFTFSHTPAFWDLDDVSVSAVPGPIVGAGIPGLVMAIGGILAWRRRKGSLAA